MIRERPDLAPFCGCEHSYLKSRSREHIAPGWIEVWCFRCGATIVNHESWFERKTDMEIENVTTTAQQPQQQPKPVDLGDMVTRGVGALPLDGILRVGVLCGMQGKLDPWLAFCRAEVARLSPEGPNTVSFPAVPMSEDVDAKIAALVKEAIAKQGASKRKPLTKKAPKKKAAKRKARK